MAKSKAAVSRSGYIAGTDKKKVLNLENIKQNIKATMAKSKAKAKAAPVEVSKDPKAAAKAAAKSQAKPKASPKLTAKNLAKHEKEFAQLSFDEKLEVMKDKTPSEIDKLSKLLSKLDKSKLWNRHNTACNNNPELKETRDAQKGKAAKGLLSLSWNLDPSLGPLYESLTKAVIVSEKLKRP